MSHFPTVTLDDVADGRRRSWQNVDASPALGIIAELVARGSTWVRGEGNSMAPTICDGDRVLLRSLPATGVRRGDVVVVASAHAAVLHRVRGISAEGPLETWGDAKLTSDGVVSPESVLAIGVLAERGGSRIALRSTLEFGVGAYIRGAALRARLRLARAWREARALLFATAW